jgi:hypothetical protein
MDSSDLGLERGVDEPVSSKHSLALELRRNNHSLESLSAAAYINPKKTERQRGINKGKEKENASTS